MKKTQFTVFSLLITIIGLGWMLTTPVLFPAVEADASGTAAHPGFIAPGFALDTPLGNTTKLSDFEGSPVLVFFWASWCSICRSAMPGLEAVYQDFASQGFTILAINTTNQDTLSTALSYFDAQGYTFPLLLDHNGSVANLYRLRAVPTSILIGSDGIITDVVYGSGISAGFLRARLADLLSQGTD